MTFLKRLLSTVILLGLMYIAFFTNGRHAFATFGVLAVAVSYLSVRELCGMLKAIGRDSFPQIASAASATLIAVILTGYLSLAAAVVLITCAQAWLLILIANKRPEAVEKALNTVAVFFMISIPFCIMAALYMQAREALLFLILVTKAGDIGAYVVGMLSGKILKGGNHKMAPSISPAKSWEGAAGGLAASIGVSILLWSMASSGLSLYVMIALGFVLFLGGFAGDLAESSLKRTCGVKDSGSFLPGIGGILDLMDSLLINSSIFYLFLLFLKATQ